MKSYSNFVIFKTSELFEDKVKMKGIGGRELVIDPSFRPEENIRIYGEVTALPLKLSQVPLMQEPKGKPDYHDYSPFNYKWVSDIEMEVKDGDRIYFHFNTIRQANFVDITGVHPNRVWYIKVPYDQILCAVRDRAIHPIGSYVLVDQEKETWDDITIPTYSNLKDKDGKPMLKPKEQWIVTKQAPGEVFLTGHVRHIGSPLIGDKCELEVGDKIYYRMHANWENNIEGNKYLTIRQRHILGKEVDGQMVPINNYMLLEGDAYRDKTDSGIYIAKKANPTGVVTHPGSSKYKVGQTVYIGDAQRQQLELNGKNYFVIKSQDVFAHE